jgi:hypothetical protein
MDDKLPNPAPLELGESLAGYILRLTALNYYDRPQRITSLAGLSNILGIAPTASADLTALSNLTGVPIEELQSRTYPGVKHESSPFTAVSFFGHPVAVSIIRNEKTKVCPACLKEFGYCRAVWDLLPVTTCPLHECLLMRHCPHCNNRVFSNRRGVSLCAVCNFDWRNSTVALVDVAEIRLSNRVHQLLQLPVSAKPYAAFVEDHPLMSVDLLYLFTAVLLLAGECEGFRDMVGRTWDSRGTDSDPHKAIVEALSICDQWPYNFWAFLDELRYEDEENHKPGIRGAFGEFYRTLFLRLTCRSFDFMRAAFHEYLDENPVFRTDERRSTIGRSKRKYLSKPEAQRRLGGVRMVNYLIEAGKLKTTTTRTCRNRETVLVEAKSVQGIQRQFANTLSTAQVADRLGIGLQSVTDLIEQRCLLPFRGPTVDRHPTWRFKPATINDLMRKIRKRVIDQISDSETITFHHALRIVQRVGYDMGKFVKALLDGEINACGWREDGKVLADLAFSKPQISDLADRIVKDLNVDSLYVKEAACLLKLNTGAVIFLCNSGLLDAQPASGYVRKGLLISRRSIQTFLENHIRASDLADKFDTNTAMMIRMLAAKGIEPIAATRRDSQHQYIFRKTELENVDWCELRKNINARALETTPGKTFDLKETATLIGCSQETISLIVENGLLRPSPQRSKQQIQTMDFVFTAREVSIYLERFGTRTDVVSGKVAAKMLGETSCTFHQTWVNSGFLKYFAPKVKRGRLRYFLKEDVQKIIELKSKTITTVEAIKLLGLSQQHLSKIVNRGVLTPVSGPKIDGCGRNRYLRTAVQLLVSDT